MQKPSKGAHEVGSRPSQDRPPAPPPAPQQHFGIELLRPASQAQPSCGFPVQQTLADVIKDVQAPSSKQALTKPEGEFSLGGVSLQDYDDLLSPYRQLFQLVHLPEIERHFHEDRAFVAQRVAGCNPVVMERVTTWPQNFPVTEAQYQAVMGEQDSLAAALQEGRLYLADYQILEQVEEWIEAEKSQLVFEKD